MTDEETQYFNERFNSLEDKIRNVERLAFAKLKISQVIDISDDKVHVVKQVVNTWESPEGLRIMVK